jgi:prefoldin subunit 5
MPGISEILDQQRRIRAQKREIVELRGELEALRSQNERMRQAMRRCVTCEYRIEVDARRRGAEPVVVTSGS